MNSEEQVVKIAAALAELKKELENLEKLGSDIPTVEKNAERMRGALRQLEVQFNYLAEVYRS